MTCVVGHGEFGMALQKALGLEGKKVTSIEFRAAVDEVVTIKAETLVIDKEAAEVASLFTKYELVEAGLRERVEAVLFRYRGVDLTGEAISAIAREIVGR